MAWIFKFLSVLLMYNSLEALVFKQVHNTLKTFTVGNILKTKYCQFTNLSSYNLQTIL